MLVPFRRNINNVFFGCHYTIYLALSYSQFLETFFETEPLELTNWNLDIKTGLLFGITGLIVAAVSFLMMF